MLIVGSVKNTMRFNPPTTKIPKVKKKVILLRLIEVFVCENIRKNKIHNAGTV